MKPLILLLLLTGACSAQTANTGQKWIRVGGDQNAIAFYDADSIRRDGDKVTVLLRAEMPNGSEAAGLTKGVHPEFYSGETLAVAQCKESRVSSVGSAVVRYYYQDGTLARTRKEPSSIVSSQWGPLLDQFCEVGSDDKPLIAPTLRTREQARPSIDDSGRQSAVVSPEKQTTEHPAHRQ